jgi:hypothetical protein
MIELGISKIVFDVDEYRDVFDGLLLDVAN